MAKKEVAKEDADAAAGGEKKGGNSKKMIMLAVLALLVIGASVGGTLLAIKMLAPPPPPDPAEAVAEKDPLPEPAIYFSMSPPVIVNFNVKGRQRFLQVEIDVMTRERDVVSAIELHKPMIMNSLVLLIGGQDYFELLTAEGKELLRQQCLQEVQRLLQKEIGKPGIEQIFFTNFVMQ
jgi:flagellar protein FliL